MHAPWSHEHGVGPDPCLLQKRSIVCNQPLGPLLAYRFVLRVVGCGALCPLAPDAVFSPENDSLRGSTTVLQQAAPTFLSQTAATSTGPENFLDPEISNVGEAGPEAARGTGLEFSVGDDGEAAVERCEGCGRTFAPGRLQSHAKVR